jgi:hypothetical protein
MGQIEKGIDLGVVANIGQAGWVNAGAKTHGHGMNLESGAARLGPRRQAAPHGAVEFLLETAPHAVCGLPKEFRHIGIERYRGSHNEAS